MDQFLGIGCLVVRQIVLSLPCNAAAAATIAAADAVTAIAAADGFVGSFVVVAGGAGTVASAGAGTNGAIVGRGCCG